MSSVNYYGGQYPDGESASPYVFICENPHELLVKFPIKGKHKICEYRILIMMIIGGRRGTCPLQLVLLSLCALMSAVVDPSAYDVVGHRLLLPVSFA